MIDDNQRMSERKAIIIGAGPAGLTAAIELQANTDIKPVLIESSLVVGGLSRTVRYKGNRMDLGGHRFFSKSDRVMQWWLDLMPVEAHSDGGGQLQYRGKRREVPSPTVAPNSETDDLVMLIRQRKSRIFFLRRFFQYPIQLNADTLKSLGLVRTCSACLSYLRALLLPQRSVRSLEDFLINRFGRYLYLAFFKSYTEKVWGMPCSQISADWGAQRIKGISLFRVAAHFFKQGFRPRGPVGISQKETDTSLIEKFLYPKFGPGQLWERAAELVEAAGGEIHKGVTIDRVCIEENKVVSVHGVDQAGKRVDFAGEYFFSTMPIRDLIRAISGDVPADVRQVAEGLIYRDFIIVGLLANRLAMTEKNGAPLKDNWIYIQEPDVQVARLQIFNNWSPWMVDRKDRVWIGLEYFCNESDALWRLSDDEMAAVAIEEAARMGILKAADVEDTHVVHVPKAYPAYFGSYDRFEVLRGYLDRIENLFLVGRNGMHKYNNQDHSMLTAMAAVENIAGGVTTKDNLWAINTEMEYHEDKATL